MSAGQGSTPAGTREALAVRRREGIGPIDYTRRWWLRLTVGATFLMLYAPIILLVVYSFNNSRRNIVWRGFTFKYYEKAWNNDSLIEAFVNSLTIALINTAVATLLGVMVALALTLPNDDPRFEAMRDELHGLIVQRVFLLGGTAAAAAFQRNEGLFVAAGHDVVQVVGLAAFFPVLDQAHDLFVRNEGAVHAHRYAAAGRQVQHVAMAEQLLGTALVEDRTGIDLGRHLETDACRDVGLDQPGDHVH